MNRRRRPSRSAIRPPSSRKPPNVSAYAFGIQVRFSGEKFRSWPIDGIATLTIATSSTITNCVVAEQSERQPFAALGGLSIGHRWYSRGARVNMRVGSA